MDWKPVIEAVKEALRVAVLGLVSAVVVILLDAFASIDNPSIWVIVLTPVLKAVDKYIHKSELPANGLLPF